MVQVTRAYSQTDSLVFAVDTVQVRQLYDSIRPRLVPAEKDDSGRGSQETESVGGPVHSFSVTVEGVEYRVASGDAPSLMPLLPQPWPGFPPLPNGS